MCWDGYLPWQYERHVGQFFLFQVRPGYCTRREREEVVDDYVLQEIVADTVLRWFVMNLKQLIRVVESSGFLRKPNRFSY